ncbi:Uncharacterised protein [Enterobacter cloacae]|nr:Uncharacterised protein [Enterobacter cloacae]
MFLYGEYLLDISRFLFMNSVLVIKILWNEN